MNRNARTAAAALALFSAAGLGGPGPARAAPDVAPATAPAPTASPTTVPITAPAAPATEDERAVAAIIEDLESDVSRVREAASDRLERLGPDVVPVLERYRDYDNPEVRARVNGVLRAFAWMRQGAVVTDVTGGSPADRLGMRVGDVVVKVNDTPVATHRDFSRLRDKDRPTAVVLWRAGRTVKIEVPAGKVGFSSSNWDATKGGADQSRGLAALSRGKPADLDEAYARLRTARTAGLEDMNSLDMLAALAAQRFDAVYADDVYRGAHPPPGDCRLTHDDNDRRMRGLPFASPHTRALLARYRAEPYAPTLAHELEEWFGDDGRNGPLLAELLAKPWVAGPEVADATFYHAQAQMRLGLHERRYDDVLKAHATRVNDQMPPYFEQTILTLQAAARGGHADRAAALGLAMLNPKDLADGDKPQPAWWGLAAAAVGGDAKGVDAYLARLTEMSPDERRSAEGLASVDALNLPPAAAALGRWFAGRKDNDRDPQPGRLEQIALAGLVADRDATGERFDALTRGRTPGGGASGAYDVTLLTGLLRFGRYEAASAAADAIAARQKDNANAKAACEAARKVVAFAAAHKAELAGPWKELRGVVRVTPRPSDGSTWALRFDGEVFRVGKDGTVKRFDGLPAILPAPVTVGYDHLSPKPDHVAVLYPWGRGHVTESNGELPDAVYLLDESAGRWVPAEQWKKPIGPDRRSAVTRGLLAGQVARDYSPPADDLGPAPTPRMSTRPRPEQLWFEGDVLLYVDPKTGKATDLSAAVGKAAGRDRPARVYRPASPVDKTYLLLSDCGAWTFDPAGGAVRRVPLGLADENVMACRLREPNYPRPPAGKAWVGVAPQQGGQIFLVDVKAGTADPRPGGFNGLGPEDWYADRKEQWHVVDPQPALYAWLLGRVGKP